MDPREEVLELGRALHRLLLSYHTNASEMSRELGFYSGHLARVLNGRRPMRVQLVFEILEKLQLAPPRFFTIVYPLGGVAQRSLVTAAQADAEPDGMAALAETVYRRQVERGEAVTSQNVALRLGEILRRELKLAKCSQRDVSAAAGLSKDALGQALRGNSELTFLHVFAVLKATGHSPARLFAELFMPAPETPADAFDRSLSLDALEPLMKATAEGLLKRRLSAESAPQAPAKKVGVRKKPAAKKRAPKKRRSSAR